MKRTLLFIVLMLNAYLTFCQKMVKEAIFCKTLNDTIHLNVYLPKDWDKKDKYQAIYCFDNDEDNMVALDLRLQTDFWYTKWLPKTIVVGVVDGRNKIDFNFQTGQLDEKGNNFLDFFTNVIMPTIKSNYNTSTYNVIYAHSYIATYANYLFMHHPGLFNGYLLLSPERWWVDESRPTFNLDSTCIKYYNTHPTFYYLASGLKDEKRRIDYAKEIAEKVKQIDTTNFVFKYQTFAEATHNTLIYYAIPEGLVQVFKPYYDFRQTESVSNPLAYFNKIKKDFSAIYELPISKSDANSNYYTDKFIELARKSKDTAAANQFAKYFLYDSAIGIDYDEFGDLFFSLGLKNRAIECYTQGIAKAESSELNTTQGYITVQWAYRNLIFTAYANDSVAAWNTMQVVLKDTNIRDPRLRIMHYLFGDLAIKYAYHLEDGLKELKEYTVAFKDAETATWARREAGVTEDVLDNEIGKCYLLLHNKKEAKLYAQKALSINADNKDAKDLLSKL